MERMTVDETNLRGILEQCGGDYCKKIDGDCSRCGFLDMALEKLRDYEKEEENGILIHLPCRVGDTVYCWRRAVPTHWHSYYEDRWLENEDEIIPARVVNIEVLKKRTTIKVALKGKCFIKEMCDSEFTTSEDFEYCYYNIGIGAIGKTVFLTREAAEQALAKMKGEKG